MVSTSAFDNLAIASVTTSNAVSPSGTSTVPLTPGTTPGSTKSKAESIVAGSGKILVSLSFLNDARENSHEAFTLKARTHLNGNCRSTHSHEHGVLAEAGVVLFASLHPARMKSGAAETSKDSTGNVWRRVPSAYVMTSLAIENRACHVPRSVIEHTLEAGAQCALDVAIGVREPFAFNRCCVGPFRGPRSGSSESAESVREDCRPISIVQSYLLCLFDSRRIHRVDEHPVISMVRALEAS